MFNLFTVLSLHVLHTDTTMNIIIMYRPWGLITLCLLGDQLNKTVFFWYLVKVTCPVYATVHVYTLDK